MMIVVAVVIALVFAIVGMCCWIEYDCRRHLERGGSGWDLM